MMHDYFFIVSFCIIWEKDLNFIIVALLVFNVKEIVHLKKMVLILFFHTKETFRRMFPSKHFWGTINFHFKEKTIMVVNGAPEFFSSPQSS